MWDCSTIICNHFQKFQKFKVSSLLWWPKSMALKVTTDLSLLTKPLHSSYSLVEVGSGHRGDCSDTLGPRTAPLDVLVLMQQTGKWCRVCQSHTMCSMFYNR